MEERYDELDKDFVTPKKVNEKDIIELIDSSSEESEMQLERYISEICEHCNINIGLCTCMESEEDIKNDCIDCAQYDSLCNSYDDEESDSDCSEDLFDL